MKTKIPIIEIMLVLAGIMFMLSKQSPLALSIALISAGVIIYLVKLFSTKRTTAQNMSPSSQTKETEPVNIVPLKPVVRVSPEDRQRRLKEIVELIKTATANKIIAVEDIPDYSPDSLNSSEVEIIAKELIMPAVAMSVFDFDAKTVKALLTDNEILKIIRQGTEACRSLLFETYAEDGSWNISEELLNAIITEEPLLIYQLTNYKRETLNMIIKRLPADALLGYRFQPKSPNEVGLDNLVNFPLSKPGQPANFVYYEEIDMDMVHYLEENYDSEKILRQQAFTRIATEAPNLIAMLKRLDDIQTEEVRQIFERGFSEEIDCLFDTFDLDSDTIEGVPLSWGVRIGLDLTKLNADTVIDNYSFAGDFSDFEQVIESLSPDELMGYNEEYGNGNNDFIALLEGEINDPDGKIRKLAFGKMAQSAYFAEGIARWDNVNSDEVKTIIKAGNADWLEKLFERDDMDSVISDLPDGFIIKARLGLMELGDSEALADEYQERLDNDPDFKSKVELFAQSIVD